jgi:hypothetical protein
MLTALGLPAQERDVRDDPTYRLPSRRKSLSSNHGAAYSEHIGQM